MTDSVDVEYAGFAPPVEGCRVLAEFSGEFEERPSISLLSAHLVCDISEFRRPLLVQKS
jgi:hypothetical protein